LTVMSSMKRSVVMDEDLIDFCRYESHDVLSLFERMNPPPTACKLHTTGVIQSAPSGPHWLSVKKRPKPKRPGY